MAFPQPPSVNFHGSIKPSSSRLALPTLKPLFGSLDPMKPSYCGNTVRNLGVQDLKPVRAALTRLTERAKAEMRRQFAADQMVALSFDSNGEIQRLTI